MHGRKFTVLDGRERGGRGTGKSTGAKEDEVQEGEGAGGGGDEKHNRAGQTCTGGEDGLCWDPPEGEEGGHVGEQRVHSRSGGSTRGGGATHCFAWQPHPVSPASDSLQERRGLRFLWTLAGMRLRESQSASLHQHLNILYCRLLKGLCVTSDGSFLSSWWEGGRGGGGGLRRNTGGRRHKELRLEPALAVPVGHPVELIWI